MKKPELINQIYINSLEDERSLDELIEDRKIWLEYLGDSPMGKLIEKKLTDKINFRLKN